MWRDNSIDGLLPNRKSQDKAMNSALLMAGGPAVGCKKGGAEARSS